MDYEINNKTHLNNTNSFNSNISKNDENSVLPCIFGYDVDENTKDKKDDDEKYHSSLPLIIILDEYGNVIKNGEKEGFFNDMPFDDDNKSNYVTQLAHVKSAKTDNSSDFSQDLAKSNAIAQYVKKDNED